VADLAAIAGAIGVGLAAVGCTVAAAWPVIKKVREVVPPTVPVLPTNVSGPAFTAYAPHPEVDALDRRLRDVESKIQQSIDSRAERDRRIDGLEERERENNALLHELIGKLKANGK